MSEIEIKFSREDVSLFIFEEQDNSLFSIDETVASGYGESSYQCLENHSYGYYLSSEEYRLRVLPGIVSVSKGLHHNTGRITPGIFVGSLALELVKAFDPEMVLDSVLVEVLAVKLDLLRDTELPDEEYRNNYRTMLRDIAAKSSELLMQINSPVSQNFEPDFEKENETVYQRFAFVKSLIGTEEFNDAVNRILYSPATRWKLIEEHTDIRRTRRFSGSAIRQILSGTSRCEFEVNDNIRSVPDKILNTRKTETVDTPENRFIKFTLQRFSRFCTDCLLVFELHGYTKSVSEAQSVISTLQNHLEAPFFREISRPSTLQINSPVLQRKSGYREVLNTWILFDLAAKLIWKGGDKVYKANKRDIAILYEYWLFFQLYDMLVTKFDFTEIKQGENKAALPSGKEDIHNLIEETSDGLGLKLKSGTETSLLGRTRSETRPLNVRFSYNRTFSGNTRYEKDGDNWISKQGSWSKPLRPDYTLSFWPSGIDEDEAEKEDIIVHVHFDAKYKVRQFRILTDTNSERDENGLSTDLLEKEKEEERKGIFKNADLLKMHAYKDAIRRTSGAYILYPGEGTEKETNKLFEGFHEIIPGLGAFAIRPAGKDIGISGVSEFLDKVVSHFQNRASQRERLSIKVHDIYKVKKDKSSEINDLLPEYIERKKKTRLVPEEISVLVGYFKDDFHLEWIREKQMYNIRYIKNRKLISNEINAKYLLLYHQKEEGYRLFFKINPAGPEIVTKAELKEAHQYPFEPSKDLYIVFSLLSTCEDEFNTYDWRRVEIRDLVKNKFPVTLTLAELLNRIPQY